MQCLLDRLIEEEESACIVDKASIELDDPKVFYCSPYDGEHLKACIGLYYVDPKPTAIIDMDISELGPKHLIALEELAQDTTVICFAKKPPRYLPYYIYLGDQWVRFDGQDRTEVLDEEIARKRRVIRKLFKMRHKSKRE